MPRKQIKVEKVKKFRTREKVVKTWDSIVKAFKGEGVGYATLMKSIEEQTPLNGYYYRRLEHRPKIKAKRAPLIRGRPSFEVNGMFSIDQWAKHLKHRGP